MEQVNNIRMVVSPWRGPGKTLGFVLDGKPKRQGWATAQTSTVRVVSSVDLMHVQPHHYRVRRVEPCH